MEELFDYNLINKGENKDFKSYVKDDKEKFGEINVTQIIKNFESRDAPGKYDGDLLVDEILSLNEGNNIKKYP